MKKELSIVLNFVFSFLKIKNNKIVFESGRNRVDDNPLAVYQYMKKNGYEKKYQLIYLVNKGTNIDELDKNDVYYYRTLMGYYHLATAKYWLRSQCLGGLVKKRKNQVCIYADHGIYGLKKCGYDILNQKDMPPLEQTKQWDYYISGCKYNTEIMRSATGYKGPSLDLGLARTDKLVNIDPKKVDKIKRKLGIKDDKKVVLYAPTFREYADELEDNIINKISSIDNIHFVVTCHPLARTMMNKYKFDKKTIKAIDYDINDLLLVTDILITDYSSVIFDFLLLNKKMIFYPYDYEEYIMCRGEFYLEYRRDLPGPIAYNQKDLISEIKNELNVDKYEKKRNEFSKKYIELCDGHVCERIVNALENGEFNE